MNLDALIFMIAIFSLCLGGFIYCVVTSKEKKKD